MVSGGHCCISSARDVLPLSPLVLCDTDYVGSAEGVEAVDECDADVDFGGLAVRC